MQMRRLKALGLIATGGLSTYAAMHLLQQPYMTSWTPTTELLVIPKQPAESPNQNLLFKSERTHELANFEYSPSIQESLAKLNQWRTANTIPGYVIGVSVRGRNVWLHGDGYADIENALPCTPDTVMRIASISKSITAALLGKMMQEKKIDLDKPIRAYLTAEQFPDKYWEGQKVDITLRQLVSHLGGIRHYKKPEKPKEQEKENGNNNNNNEFEKQEYFLNQRFKSVIDSLSLFKDDPLVAKPGTKYVYTTFGWTLISAVMETQLEKKDFPKAMTRFFSELGMRHTYLDENAPLIYNRAHYYLIDPKSGHLQNVPTVDNSYKWAGGGLLSTVGDLLRFGNAMLYSFKGTDPVTGKPGFLDRSTVDQMWTPATSTKENPNDLDAFGGYGIGWVSVRGEGPKRAFTAEPRFSTIVHHSGGAVGASSLLVIDPEREIVVAFIINVQGARELYRVGFDVTEAFTKRIQADKAPEPNLKVAV